jgi:small subunit ribosomal protein S24e
MVDIEIVEKRDNPLLERTEVRFQATHPREATPPRDAMRALLAKALKKGKEVVVIDGMKSEFGRYVTTGYAKVYASKEAALRVERAHVLRRNAIEAPPKGEAAAEPEEKAKEKAPAKAAPKAKAEETPKPKKAAKPKGKAGSGKEAS